MALNETNTYQPESTYAGTVPVYSEPETFASGTLIAARTVVGRVTATKKLVKAVKTATDGSQNPVGIAVTDVDASTADAVGPVFKMGAFNPDKLVIDPSFTAEDVRLAFEGKPIFIRRLQIQTTF